MTTMNKCLDYKNLSDEELNYILNGINTQWLMHHQKVSLVFSATRDRVAYFHGIGTGKSVTALETIKLWGCKKVLIICPISAFDAWERDITKFTKFNYVFLNGSGEEKLEKINTKSNLYIINYDGLKCIYANFINSNKSKRKWVIDKSKLIHNFDCIVFDEIHRCSAYNSLQSNICLELSRRTKKVIGMTGTPIDKSLLDLFNIYNVLDLGKSLGNNFFIYRNKYFSKSKYGYEWKVKKGKDIEILNRLRESTISFERNECFDLPELQEIDKWISPSDEFINIQNDIICGNSINFNGEEFIASRDQEKIAILRQLPSGFLYYKTKSGEHTHVLKNNPKINVLMDIINDTGSKIIVFHRYIETSKIIQNNLDKNSINYVIINGGQSSVNRVNEIRKFTLDQSIKVMIAHPTCASEGFDGTISNVVVFFDPVASIKTREQCIGRIHRKGQKEKSLVINLLLKKSVDKTTIESRNNRSSIVKGVMKFIHDYHNNI